jgi:hypothetical protein
VIKHGHTRTLEFRLSFPHGIPYRLFTGSGTKRHQQHQAAHVIIRDISRPFQTEPFNSRKKKRVSLKKTKLLCAEKVSQIADETLSLFDTLSSMCALFRAPKRSILNSPRWNNCYYLPLSTSHKTQQMGKHDIVVGTAWRRCVTCSLPHRTAKSRKSCQDINYRYNGRNKKKYVGCTVTSLTLY